jgi:hypothetical protein
MLFQGSCCKVVHVIHVCYFYSKIIDDEAENDAAPDVMPEARSVLALVVTLFGKSLLEDLVGNDAGLGEAVHSFPNFDVDPSVFVNQVPEVVFYDDLFRDDVESEAHVFWIGHRGVEVEVGQVNAEEHGARCAYLRVDEEFGSEKVRSGSALVAREIDEITANCESSAIDLLLLRPDIADDATVGGALVFWDLRFSNEENRVRARYVVYSLKQSPQFVCEASFPYLFVFF